MGLVLEIYLIRATLVQTRSIKIELSIFNTLLDNAKAVQLSSTMAKVIKAAGKIILSIIQKTYVKVAEDLKQFGVLVEIC